MASQFMATIILPEEKTEEFISLIPEQRAAVIRLIQKNIILYYSLSADRTRLWICFNAANEDRVREIISRFPLFKYMKVKIDEVMFTESKIMLFPDLVLN